MHRIWQPYRLAGAATLTAIGLVACGGGAAPASSTSNGSGGDNSSGSSATLSSAQTGKGMVLTGPDGKTLYVLLSASGSPLPCSGGCASVWPPLTATSAQAGSGVSATLAVGSASQVTANGDPLYYYSGDAAPGDVNGEGITTGSGGTWYAMQPSGQPLSTTAASGASPTATAGGGY